MKRKTTKVTHENGHKKRLSSLTMLVWNAQRPDYKRDIFTSKGQGRSNVKKRPLVVVRPAEPQRFWQRQHLPNAHASRTSRLEIGVCVAESAGCKSAGDVQVSEHVKGHAVNVDAML
jgi:hypothetical protein